MILRSVIGRGLLFVLFASLLLAACAPSPEVSPGIDSMSLSWPDEQSPFHVAWVREIKKEQDAGIERSFWKRLADLVIGERQAEIAQPYGVFCDEWQRLFVVDVGLGGIHVFDLKKKKYNFIDSEKIVFQNPIGITGDSNGDIYITDSAAGAVYRYQVQENDIQLFFSLARPTGIAFNRTNNLLYVTDTISHQVVVIDLTGKKRFRIGRRGTGPGEFNYPTDLFVDRNGDLYVTDPLNARVQVFSEKGDFLRSVGGTELFTKPKGVAVDSFGNIYVCSSMLDAVQVFDPDGNLSFAIGATGNSAGEFWMPSGLYIDARDTIYVADTYNQRIQIFQRTTITGQAP